MPVTIVTDSSSDLPPALADQWGIKVVPCTIAFGDQVYRDGVDISRDEFYQRLQSSDRIPSTSQPPVGDFLDVYVPLDEAGQEVVSVHLSAKFSATLDSARQAKAAISHDTPIDIVDSWFASMGLGLIALEAAILANSGATRQEIVQHVERLRENTHVFCLLDTLEYLRKGGRIGRAQAFLASRLQIKPMLTIKEGEVHPFSRPRTRQRGIAEMVEEAQRLAPLGRVCVLHSTTPDEGDEIGKRIEDTMGVEVITAQFSAVLGTHLGPRALGLAMIRSG